MANPIIKIKSGLQKPVNYNPVTGAGLTAAELGVNLSAGQYNLYVGNTFGQAITLGAEIDADVTLGSNSDFKIATQKAIKTYANSLISSPPASPTMIHSRFKTATQTYSANTKANLIWNTTGTPVEYSIGTFPFTVNISTGTDQAYLTYTGTETAYFLIMYQVTWSQFVSTQSYNSSAVNRSAWIQKYSASHVGGGAVADTDAVKQQNVYGFSTLLCTPLASTSQGSISGTQLGSAVISLSQNEKFAITCQNNGSVATSVNISGAITLVNNQAPAVNFANGTRLQIVRI